MKKKAFRFAGFILVLASSMLLTCDPFKEDLISLDRQVVLNPNNQTVYYILPNSSTVIDLQFIVESSFVNLSLNVTNKPQQGELTKWNDFLLTYDPHTNFQEGHDSFVYSIRSTSGRIMETDTIYIVMAQDIREFPCGLYAVEDFTYTKTDSAKSIKLLANDRICGVEESSIQVTIHMAPENGQAVILGDSIANYTPSPGFKGRDSLIYKLEAIKAGDTVKLVSYGIIKVAIADCFVPLASFRDQYILDLTDDVADPIITSGKCVGGYDLLWSQLMVDVAPFILKDFCNYEFAFPSYYTNNSGFFCQQQDGSVAYFTNQQLPPKNDTLKMNICVAGLCKEVSFYVKRVKEGSPSFAGFAQYGQGIYENSSEGIDIDIILTSPATSNATIKVSTIWYGTYYTTIPAADENHLLTLSVAPGETSARFKVIPIDNADINEEGYLSIWFNITATSGSIQKGWRLDSGLEILDDDGEFPCPIVMPTNLTLDLTDNIDDSLSTIECTDGLIIPFGWARDLSCDGLYESFYVGGLGFTNNSGGFCVELGGFYTYVPNPQALPKNDYASCLTGIIADTGNKYAIVNLNVIRQ